MQQRARVASVRVRANPLATGGTRFGRALLMRFQHSAPSAPRYRGYRVLCTPHQAQVARPPQAWSPHVTLNTTPPLDPKKHETHLIHNDGLAFAKHSHTLVRKIKNAPRGSDEDLNWVVQPHNVVL